ncbi:MAG: shikimate kinase [Gemmatimonadetes bacterium]|nr:shikimate kinase [Gemmatimonadota bacterium]MBT6148820.1 shikimate kinase [Gemmatimonadota bacterium]MBT7860383.1 shikimate kinase [Gemmatimonadota bacterium]
MSPSEDLDIPIYLTGFMATGKTHVGRLLARRLQRDFVDTDDMITERAGKSIPEIFEQDGEEAFRQWERDCVEDAAYRGHVVVALGGGAISQPENLETIRRADALLVCLSADVETILERVTRRDDRPLLAGLSREEKREKIEAMLAERAPYYEKADVILHSTTDSTPETLVQDLLEVMEKRGLPTEPRR